MRNIENELAELTTNFTEKNGAIRCWSEWEKGEAKEILDNHYDIVEISDGRKSNAEDMCWVIAYENPKSLQESIKLNEGGEDDIDLSEFKDFDPQDDMDLQEYNLDAIDDSSEVKNADQITVLKKRAADLARKWKDTFNQMVELARALDLTVSHDEDFNIEITKADGKEAQIDNDLDAIEAEITPEDEPDMEEQEEIDDSFGPSEFDDRAGELGPDEEIKEESLDAPNKPLLVESNYPWSRGDTNFVSNTMSDPNEIPLRDDEIDDDF